jgi:hypothetical protein
MLFLAAFPRLSPAVSGLLDTVAADLKVEINRFSENYLHIFLTAMKFVMSK